MLDGDSTEPPAPLPGPGESAQLRHLRSEVEKLIEEARIGARRAQRRAKLWNATYLVLGFPAAVLAGVSGAAGLASPDARVPAAILALLAAGFSAGSQFLRSFERQRVNLMRRYAWQNLETDARLVLAREAYQGEEQLYRALAALTRQRRAVPSSALVLADMQPPPVVPEPRLPADPLPSREPLPPAQPPLV
ncbi:hypothetical protein [Streptomyces millisiae]|uniref:SMODS and SLOG-associating 2TM effector domain-containing protein n=1 Tax=Streptomyces millisiae TaxID=3075542 RepID=A0ABU2LJ74_9ACTN|nr:hypothetical protein [Streptomyces sp. DSM 44918]MDT0317581.1 hypothetical protein [Streptomyces sp. DSM 44918]